MNSVQSARLLASVEAEIKATSLFTGIKVLSEPVKKAFLQIPRHIFVPEKRAAEAYANVALPIGYRQTISQPFIVALMTEVLGIAPHEKVMEIGTGSGYQSAILSKVAKEVYTIECIEPLAKQAQVALQQLHISNVHGKIGNGCMGWNEYAPYHHIMVTACCTSIPQELVAQLKEGGSMVLPLQDARAQILTLVHKRAGLETYALLPVDFVPCVAIPLP